MMKLFIRTVVTAFTLFSICCERVPRPEESPSTEHEGRARKISTRSTRTENIGSGRLSVAGEENRLAKLLEEKQLYCEALDGEVSLENLEIILESVDNGDFSEGEFEELLESIFQGTELSVVKELATKVGNRISSSSLPNSALVFSRVLAESYHERADWKSGDVLETLVIPGPYEGLLVMEVGQKMVSGDQPTRAFFELLESNFEGRSKSDYGPLVRLSVSKLTASDLNLIEQIPVNQYDDFGGMIVGAVAKKLVWNASEEAVDYILNLPDSRNKEVAVFELAKLSVFFNDTEAAGLWFADLTEDELRKAVQEFARERGVQIPE